MNGPGYGWSGLSKSLLLLHVVGIAAPGRSSGGRVQVGLAGGVVRRIEDDAVGLAFGDDVAIAVIGDCKRAVVCENVQRFWPGDGDSADRRNVGGGVDVCVVRDDVMAAICEAENTNVPAPRSAPVALTPFGRARRVTRLSRES